MIEQKKAKFYKFVEKQMETNELILQTMAQMVYGFELIQQASAQVFQQCELVQQTYAQMVQEFREQINNVQSLFDELFSSADSEELCRGRPFSLGESPASPTQNEISPILIEPTSDVVDTQMSLENREVQVAHVDSSFDAVVTQITVENREELNHNVRLDAFSDAVATQISLENLVEEVDRGNPSSRIGTSSRADTLSRMNSLSDATVAQMKNIAEEATKEVKQLNLGHSSTSPAPSYHSVSEIVSSCLKTSPIPFGKQPFALVEHDETVNEETIKICFSLKGENNFFQSTLKEINGYGWSLFVQCAKMPNSLNLGLFIKCHGPVNEVGVPGCGIVRLNPPVFIVHNWKGKDEVKEQTSTSMKFQPPYDNSGGVWIELDGKKELINKGLITEDELNIQVSTLLEFRNSGSVASSDI